MKMKYTLLLCLISLFFGCQKEDISPAKTYTYKIELVGDNVQITYSQPDKIGWTIVVAVTEKDAEEYNPHNPYSCMFYAEDNGCGVKTLTYQWWTRYFHVRSSDGLIDETKTF